MSLKFQLFNLLLVVLVILFDFGLAGNKRFKINRLTLILIPFISMLVYAPVGFSTSNFFAETYQVILPEFSVSGNHENTIWGYSWILYIYVMVALGLFIRGLFILIKDFKAGTPTELNGIPIRAISKGGSYSLFNRIYLAPEDLDNSLILSHEQAHVAQKHSLDMVFANIITALLWFNPIVWRWKILMIQNHEYLADEVILNGSTEQAKEYIHLLLDRALNTNQFSLGNYFSLNSLISKRIIMVNTKTKQKKWRTAALVALMLGSTVYISACNKLSRQENPPVSPTQTEMEKTIEIEKEVFNAADVMPEFPGGKQAMFEYIGKNIMYPKGCEAEGVVKVKFIISKQGVVEDVRAINSIHELLDAEAIRVIESMPNWSPGETEGKKVNVEMIIPIRFELRVED